MSALFDSLKTDRLQWLPELGLGWYPVSAGAAPYDAAYWQRYREQDRSPMGEALTAARWALVRRHLSHGHLIDIGVGGGRFIESAPDRFSASGFDVNPAAVDWLQTSGRWCDPMEATVYAATFWDSLEHIGDPAALLAQVRGYAFVSLPIFEGPEHVLRSKHYRRDEHFWHFTRAGFVGWMGRLGFEMVENNRMETEIGREDIESFACVRRDGAR